MSVFENESAHALVVGIARYQNIRQLPEVKDATDIAALLADEKRGGYPDKNVRLLRDEEATLTAIRRELVELAGRASPESAVFIYFSGHGGAVASGPRAGQYLLPVDVAYPDDDALAATAIRDQEFTEALRAIPAQKVLIVLDCCHAGGIGQPRILSAAGQDLPRPLSDYDVLRGGEGRVILASSRADELSWVPAGSEYGFVRVFDLFEYLQPKVTAERRDQRPYFKGELGSNFPVALSQGGGRAPRPGRTTGFATTFTSATSTDRPTATGCGIPCCRGCEGPGCGWRCPRTYSNRGSRGWSASNGRSSSPGGPSWSCPSSRSATKTCISRTYWLKPSG